jgi:hypothetical protein
MLLKDFKTNELAYILQVVNSGKDLKTKYIAQPFSVKISKERT